MNGIKEVNGVFVPEGETHMTEFLKQQTNLGIGLYQYGKLQRAVRHCYKRRRAIDVGAHVGTWSMHLVKLFGHVEAFEPHPVHRVCFLHNMAEVSPRKYALYEYALGDVHAEDVLLSAGINSTGDTWIAPQDEYRVEDRTPVGLRDDRDYQIVDMRMLDQFEFVNVDFVKIDCEGFELFVLKGGRETIRRWSPVICVEQKPGHATRFGLNDTEACSYLEGLGYQLVEEITGDYIFVRR